MNHWQERPRELRIYSTKRRHLPMQKIFETIKDSLKYLIDPLKIIKCQQIVKRD